MLWNNQSNRSGHEIWNVRSLYMSGALETVARKVSKCIFSGSTGGQVGQGWH
jgi:hypothetical protein